MKNKRYTIFLPKIVLAIILGLVSACGGGGDPEPTATQAEEVTKVLSGGTWKLSTVMVDGTDQTNVYKGLTLNFTSTSITASGGGSVWPASSTWKFTDDTATTIERGDGVKVTIAEAKADKLSLVLTWTKTTLASGRVNSVKGQHTFNFGK